MLTALLVTLASTFALAEAPAPPADAPLPEELSSLSPLWDDEAKLLEGVRQFDIIQQGLADWDRQLAADHEMAGDAEQARRKEAQAQRRLDLVRQAYQEVLKRYPENARARVYLGELLSDHYERPDQAAKLWQEALKLDPSLHEAMNDLAIHYSHHGDVDKSLEYFDQALKLAPDNPDYLYNVTQIYLIHWPQVQKHYGWSEKEVHEKALEYSRRAAELQPDDYALLSDYALNFFRLEQMKLPVDWEQAAKAWQAARTRARNKVELSYTWLNEGRVWLRARDKEKAAACIQESLKLFPNSEAAKNLLAEARSGA